MTYKTCSACRKYLSLFVTLLYLQAASAQGDFGAVGNWLKDNVKDLGGRAVIVIFKDGKIVYNQAENNLSRGQKMVGKFIARRQGKTLMK